MTIYYIVWGIAVAIEQNTGTYWQWHNIYIMYYIDILYEYVYLPTYMIYYILSVIFKRQYYLALNI